MKVIIVILVVSATIPSIGQINKSEAGKGYFLHYFDEDPSIERLQGFVTSGLPYVSEFLGRNYKKDVNVYVFPDRKELDIAWQTAWGMPSFQSQCWMVGSGIQSRLDLLSPSVWDDQACEHDGDDFVEQKMLVLHELTHVLHSDYNISPDFSDINNIDWFVEGLATFVSGQLDKERMAETMKHVQDTGGPEKLANFWTGQHKYGLAGSMVAYIDDRFGRATLSELMTMNDVIDILNNLEISEEMLITAWREDLLSR